jgi:hypothetical protein
MYLFTLLLTAFSYIEDEFCISSVPESVLNEVTGTYGIRTETPKWNGRSDVLNEFDSAPFPNFEWDESQEGSKKQRGRYMEFLNQIFSWPQNYKIVDVSKASLFSNVKLARYRFKGSIDVILLDNGSAESVNYKNNIRIGIELKKPVLTNQNHTQACIEQLCAASLNYENSVLTLLTDLNDAWIFIYFGSNAKLYKLRTSRSEAKFLLDNMFNQNELEQSCFPEDFVNRLSWNKFVKSFIPALSGTPFLDRHNHDDRDEYRRQDQDDSEIFRKRKTNPIKRSANTKDDSKGSGNGNEHAKMLHFGGDVANELDLLDFFDDEEEKTQIVLRYVLDNVVPMLMFSDAADEKETSSASASSSSLQQVSSSHHVSPSQQQQDDEGSGEKFVSSCGSTSELSEQNLLHHNSAVRGTGT